MHVLIIHCHPESKSFNATLTNISVKTFQHQGHTVEISDLYAENFDPVEKGDHYKNRNDETQFSALAEQRKAFKTNTLPADVDREVSRLERADLVVFQFPLWWHAQPAMLKGWFDRVFISGGLYTSSMRYDQGVFRGKRAMCSVTTGAPGIAFGPGARGGDIEVLLWPVQYSLYYMGFSVLPPFLAFGIQGHGYGNEDPTKYSEKLDRYLSDWAERLNSIHHAKPLSFPGWKDWDEDGRYLERIANKH